MSDHAMTMYALRPIVKLPKIPCSKTMYVMRSIHENQRESRRRHNDANTDVKMPDDVIIEQKPLPEYSALEIRQEKILNQLAELKKQVSTLRQFLKESYNIVQTDCIPKKTVNLNLLIKVSPKRKPFSLCALQRLWQDTDFRITIYTHSSVKQEVPDRFPAHIISTTKNVVNITMIWKEIPLLEVFTDLQNEPIIGQINLLRYLYRAINTYENDHTQTLLMDKVLDMCYVACCQKFRTEKILFELSDTLNEWSGKDKPNIADVAVWSMIKELYIITLPDPIIEWKNECDKIFINLKNRSLFFESSYDDMNYL